MHSYEMELEWLILDCIFLGYLLVFGEEGRKRCS